MNQGTPPNTPAPPDHGRLFDPAHRTVSIGILLGVTLFAFEALAVVTIAPRFTAELGGTALYGWVFSGLLLTSLLGTVLGGEQADRRGPGWVVLVALAVFGAGLAVSAAAPTMPVLILGRLLQGLGGGALLTALYAAVNLAYSDALRPALFAAMSSAWVVPGLVGPLLAGLIAETLGWRAVFWGLLPLLVVVGLLLVPAFRRFSPAAATPVARSLGEEQASSRLLRALGLVFGTGLLLLGLTLVSLWGALLLILGALLALWSLRQLVPPGTLRLGPGLPSVVASRGLFYAAFAGVEAFLALMLVRVHGYSEALTGLAIATGALSWALGSFLQARLDARLDAGDQRGRDAARAGRLRLGTLLLTVGLSVQLGALFSPVFVLPISIAGWALAGLGIGLAHATASVLAFSLSATGQGGAVAAALQLADSFTSALSTGVGGALLALALRRGFGEQGGVAWAFGLCLLLVALSVLAAGRIAPGLGGTNVGEGAAAAPAGR